MTQKQLLTDFGELYPIFPQEKPYLPRKIHDWCFTFKRFVEIHKTIGLFSEEDETLHKVVNQHNRQLVGIHNTVAKQLIQHQHLENTGSCDCATLVPPQRRC